MLNNADLSLLKRKNISVELFEKQLDRFKKGFPHINLIKAATTGNGIMLVSESDKEHFIGIHERNNNKKITKFVPASGAASRMFKSLYEFKELYDGNNEGYANFMKSSGLNSVLGLIMKIRKFAFYDDLAEILKNKGKDIDEMIACMDYAGIIDTIIGEEGLNYGNLPKALIQFHKYANDSRTALEEHLVEGVLYCKDRQGKVNLHFTVSPNHKQLFLTTVSKILSKYEKQYNVGFNIDYSVQKESTDTIAVDMDNKPYRDKEGNLLFRPGGHGALIENLNEIDSDIVFIKNIDNVVIDSLKAVTVEYKKILSGILQHYQQKIFKYLEILQHDTQPNIIKEISEFIEKDLCVLPGNRELNTDYLTEKLNRPIRVCGMVRNQGEPGGGPFWCKNNDGTVSLQIVESSQINKENKLQSDILQNSTHFNPVDIVCSIKKYNGEKFDLSDFVDNDTGFISEKSYNGDKIKAQELPGLWNGAMSNWNTIFVEVPLITFNPVKTIDDLLRKEHCI